MNIQLENERAPQSQYFQGLSTKRHVMRKMSDRKFMASHAAYEGPFSLTSRTISCTAFILLSHLPSYKLSHTDLERSRNHVSVLPAYSMITVREY